MTSAPKFVKNFGAEVINRMLFRRTLILVPSAKVADGKATEWYKRAAKQGCELGKIKAQEYELFKFYK